MDGGDGDGCGSADGGHGGGDSVDGGDGDGCRGGNADGGDDSTSRRVGGGRGLIFPHFFLFVSVFV